MSRGGELLCLGISHKTAPVAVRERLALTDAGRAGAVPRAGRASDAIREAVAISTCNRTEIYVVGDPVAAESELLAALARRAGTRPTELAEAMYAPRNCDAARQLYRVVSGLESMIVGEAEIQGQAKRAYEAALEAGTTGPMTNRLFTAALQTGKRVRSETAIGDGRASACPASPSGSRATSMGPDLDKRDVVIIGAGETSRADRPGAGRAGRPDDLRRQPPRRPRALDRRSLRRQRLLAARPARAPGRGRHRRLLDLLAAPDRSASTSWRWSCASATARRCC